MLSKYLKFVAPAILAAGCMSANASVIFLLGTDAIGFHGDASYINPVMNQLVNGGGGGTNKVLFVNDYGAGSTNYSGGIATINFAASSSIDSSSDLSAYEALYFDASGTCCSDPASTLTGVGVAAKISSFLSSGGNIAVGNYAGDSFWDSILGFAGGPGVTTGVGGVICEDPGTATASGLAFGYDPTYFEGCFIHQTYSPSFWASKGFFALQINGDSGSQFAGDWVTMASGFVDPGRVPEPTSIALLALGLASVGLSRRFSKKA